MKKVEVRMQNRKWARGRMSAEGAERIADLERKGCHPQQQAKVLGKTWLFDENLSFAGVAGDGVATGGAGRRGLTTSVMTVLSAGTEPAGIGRLDRGELGRQLLAVRAGRGGAGGRTDCWAGLVALLGEMALESARGEVDGRRLARIRGVCGVRAVDDIGAARGESFARRASTTRERFEFDAATACVLRQTEINSILEDETLTDEERIRSVREELFGPDLPE